MLEHVFILSWIGSIFCVHLGYTLCNIQIFSGLKCSEMFVFQCQCLIEIRKIRLNLIPHLGKVCSYGVEMLAKLKWWNIFVICYKDMEVFFVCEHFGYILWNIGILAQMLVKLELANLCFILLWIGSNLFELFWYIL